MKSGGKRVENNAQPSAVQIFREIGSITDETWPERRGRAAVTKKDGFKIANNEFAKFGASGRVSGARFADKAPVVSSNIKGDTARVRAMAERLQGDPTELKGQLLAMVVKSSMS